MKKFQIIAMVVGASVVTFVLAVVFSINMVSISPKNLAKVIEQDPAMFFDALKEASENYKKISEKKALAEQFKNPAKIQTKGRVTFGDSESPITIVEFSDFQCPYCAKASVNMKALMSKYDGKVNVVYKHFPLGFHPFALPAAEFFEAVALVDQNKAKKFHDEIFDNFSVYAKLKDPSDITKKIKAILKKIDVDWKMVESNLEKAKAVVKEDMAEASKLQVRGTPSFFVNGVKAQGSIELVIDKWLEKI